MDRRPAEEKAYYKTEVFMGQHKYNEIAMKAKLGEIQPIPRCAASRDLQRLITARVLEVTRISYLLSRFPYE